MISTIQSVIQDVKRKVYQPVYFVYGDEPYYIDRIMSSLEKSVLTEEERAFNQTILYGLDVNAAQVIAEARTYPVGAARRLVIIKEAQMMRDIIKLQPYIEHLQPTTILAMGYKKKQFDKRTKFAKAIQNNACLVESKILYENKIPDWINSYVRSKGYSIGLPATMLLTEYLGADLSKIARELDKLSLNLQIGDSIEGDTIEKYIGISREYNVFELINAIADRNIKKAYRIVKYFKENPKASPFVVTLGAIYAFFSRVLMVYTSGRSGVALAPLLKVNPYFVKQYESAARKYSPENSERIIGLLSQYDLRAKGAGGTGEGDLLIELVHKIMNKDVATLPI